MHNVGDVLTSPALRSPNFGSIGGDSIKNRVSCPYRFPVTPIKIVQMLEAWLVADPAALERVAGIKRSFPGPERIRNPKAELQGFLARRAAYTPEIARRIAEGIDLDF